MSSFDFCFLFQIPQQTRREIGWDCLKISSSNYRDEIASIQINENALDTKPKSGFDRSVSDEDVFKSSSSVFGTDLSTSIQIEDRRKPYLDALRSLYVENAANDYLERKLVHDLLKTQCRDSDLFQTSCCCGILWMKASVSSYVGIFLSRSSSSKQNYFHVKQTSFSRCIYWMYRVEK